MSKIVNTDLDMDSVGMVTNLPAPTSGGDAANKTYVDTKEPAFTTLPISKGGTNSSTALTGNKAIVSNGTQIIESSTTSTEVGYLSGVTSAIQTQIDNKVTSNSAITGSTKTKITYDTKGLVTAGADANLDDLGDVVITTPTTNQVLKYNGTNWVNDTASGGASALDDLTDVVITSPAKNETLRYDGTNWVNQKDVNPKSHVVLYDDFVHGFVNSAWSLGWTTGTGGTGAQTTAAVHDDVACGVVQLQTGTTATGWVAMGLGNTIFIPSGSSLYCEAYVRIPTLRTATQEFKAYFGFGDSVGTNADMVDGAYFTHDSTSTNWVMNTANNNVRTATATSTAVVANQWYRLGIQIASGGGSAEFFIDGVSVGTIATNVPTTRNTGGIYKIVKTVGTTSRTMDCDYWYSLTEFINERS